MADRCTGHCCEDFILPFSPSELHTHTDGYRDADLIARMVLYKGKYRAANRNFPGEAVAHHYTCRYFDTVTRDCTIYEQRPTMCRDHPYEKPCTFKGCELTPELKPDVLLSKVLLYSKLDRGITVRLSDLDTSITQLVQKLKEK